VEMRMVIPFFGFKGQKLLSAKSGQRLIFVWPFSETTAVSGKFNETVGEH
jgi:hypothetical protein